jgi:hypothetical protein
MCRWLGVEPMGMVYTLASVDKFARFRGSHRGAHHNLAKLLSRCDSPSSGYSTGDPFSGPDRIRGCDGQPRLSSGSGGFARFQYCGIMVDLDGLRFQGVGTITSIRKAIYRHSSVADTSEGLFSSQ